MGTCCECGAEIQTGWSFYEEVSGWAKRRTQGGANAITKRVPTGRVMCRGCMESSKQMPGQQALFD